MRERRSGRCEPAVPSVFLQNCRKPWCKATFPVPRRRRYAVSSASSDRALIATNPAASQARPMLCVVAGGPAPASWTGDRVMHSSFGEVGTTPSVRRKRYDRCRICRHNQHLDPRLAPIEPRQLTTPVGRSASRGVTQPIPSRPCRHRSATPRRSRHADQCLAGLEDPPTVPAGSGRGLPLRISLRFRSMLCYPVEPRRHKGPGCWPDRSPAIRGPGCGSPVTEH